MPVIPASGGGKFGLCEPFLTIFRRNADGRSLDEPLPALTAQGTHVGLAEPFLVKFNGTGGAQSLDDPLDTVTTKDRFGLVQIEGTTYALDVKLRMLQPHELQLAMGFGDDYVFTGNRGEQIKQIGNAVCVHTAEALCRTALARYTRTEQRQQMAFC